MESLSGEGLGKLDKKTGLGGREIQKAPYRFIDASPFSQVALGRQEALQHCHFPGMLGDGLIQMPRGIRKPLLFEFDQSKVKKCVRVVRRQSQRPAKVACRAALIAPVQGVDSQIVQYWD